MHSSLPPSPPDNVPVDPLQPVTMPVVPAAHQPIDQQQTQLIQALGRLNAQTDALLQEQPSLETVYQQQLAAVFPELPRPIHPDRIFYSRYREDVDGQKQLLGSESLGSLLTRLRSPGADAYLTQESGAFYREGDTLEEDKRLSPASPTATLAGLLEIAFTVKLNEFWTFRESDQPTTEAQLVALRRQVLAHQLALRTLDGTLSAAARALADSVLKYPTAAAREALFPAGQRPGAYRLALENGSAFAGAFILNATGGTPPLGRVMLYSPSEGFEEFEHLGQLNHTVAARLNAGGSAGQRLVASLPLADQAPLAGLPVLTTNPPLIEADVIADHIHSLRVRQYFNTQATLRKDPLPLAGDLDRAGDLAPQLDVSAALASRNLRLVAPRDPDWLSAASPADQQQYRQLETSLMDSHEVLAPLLEKIATFAAFAEQETGKVLKLQKPEYASVELAPYKSLVRLRVTASMPAKVTGYRDAASDVVYISEDPQIDIPQVLSERTLTFGNWNAKVVVDLRTLGSYARRNVDPWSAHELHRTISASADIVDASGQKRGRLEDADLRALARQADVGKQYEAYLRSAFLPHGEGRVFAGAWQRASATALRKDALESRLNPSVYDLFSFKTPGGGMDWIKAITEYPDSTTRPPVGRSDIEVNSLVMGGGLEGGQGGQVINGVLVIQRIGTKPGGVCVLYTPQAPDNAPFRELVLGLVELDALKAKPEWRAYFTQRMATGDARELARIFSDTRSVHRYAVTPITGDLHAYLYSAQLGFQLAHADYRSRTNAEIALESAVNGFLFSVEVADFLLGLSLFKTLRRLAHRYIVRGVNHAQKVGRAIPGLIRKIGADNTPYIAIAKPSIRPLDPGWVDVASYRLPKQIDALFDVDDFAQAHQYRLSRTLGAPSFIDSRNQHFIAMRAEDGRYHLYASYVEDGARYVKDPAGNKADFMVVPGDAKSWKPRFERTTRGGGAVLGVLRARTPEQQVEDDLLAALRMFSPAGHGEALLKELTVLQKRRLWDNALQQLNVDESTFRRIVWGQQGSARPPQLRQALLMIEFDAHVYTHLNKTTHFLSEHLTLSPIELDNLFIKIKRLIGKNDDFAKHIRASISIADHDTGAKLVGYAFTYKQVKSLDKFDRKYHLSTWSNDTIEAFLREKGRREIVEKIAANHKITFNDALQQLLSSPKSKEALEAFRIEKRHALLNTLGVDSISDDFKKYGVPYIALSYGERTGTASGLKVIDSVTVAEFEKTIPKFSTPLELTPPRHRTHKVEKPSGRPGMSSLPAPAAPSEAITNIVKLDELAETQLSLLPDSAKSKLDEIIQDIQGGRVSRKKIGSNTYVDLPQLDPGTGRGRWRVAFEKTAKEGEKDVYRLKGIFDYHANRRRVWGV
ncbi:dermonecrotic toxin domain-containing protein [Pseudomonas allii]|uniref:Dermonecrotic toxin N-terminal domain-containing protein n=1 Tax=Pseudomonas allii TaxID=2740531 RepID=A0A7Y8RLT8_9PSED|nr:DUF6543 domain-containing protein [Pseudomonas allii]NWN61366.1 hypothetical protein [Pseudomonas allii]